MKKLLALLAITVLSASAFGELPNATDTDAAAPVMPAGSSGAAIPSDPKLADVRVFVDHKQYEAGLQAATKLLEKATRSDRYDLYLLKAQCYLGLKNPDAAMLAFASAEKSSTVVRKTTVAFASIELLRHAPGLHYKPSFVMADIDPEEQSADPFNLVFDAAPPDVEPIDVVVPESRADAISALFVDELKLALPDLKASENSKTIPPLEVGAAKLVKLWKLETAGKGVSPRTSAMLTALSASATTLMTSSLTTMNLQEQQVSKNMNAIPQSATGGPVMPSPSDAGILDGIISSCEKIISACDDLNAASAANTSTEGTFTRISSEAQDVEQNAKNLLNGLPMTAVTIAAAQGNTGGRRGGGGPGAGATGTTGGGGPGGGGPAGGFGAHGWGHGGGGGGAPGQ